ncbi:MAG TPA: DNA translocase FtsK, partial [Microvirga sp.]|nr:DNA translocase FtsK [Microvirga sp.]
MAAGEEQAFRGAGPVSFSVSYPISFSWQPAGYQIREHAAAATPEPAAQAESRGEEPAAEHTKTDAVQAAPSVVIDPEDVDAGYLSLYEEAWQTSRASSPAVPSEEGRGAVETPVIAAIRPHLPPVAAADNDDEADAVSTEADAPSVPVAASVLPAARTEPRVEAPSRPLVQGTYELPHIEYLAEPPLREGPALTEDILEETAGRVEKVIRDFGVKGEVIHVHPGPVVTLYELEPAPGTKSSRVVALSDDIARSMSAVSARVAVIPGRNAIGIELPNRERETVYLRELLTSQDFETSKQKLPLCLGKTIGGEPVIADLARMPHLLVAGTTG